MTTDAAPSRSTFSPQLPDPATPAPNNSQPLPIGLALITLALPILGEQFFNILVGLVDTFLAGRISKEAIAAVGIASYVGWLASMLSGLIGIGAMALVARASGAQDRILANRITNQAMGLAGFFGLFMALLILSLSGLLPRLMGLKGEALPMATQYLQIDALGQFLYAYMLVGAACLRGAGDTRTPMLIMLVINVVNMVVSALLAFGFGPVPALGVVGIVIGTVTARALGGVLMLRVLTRGRGGLRLHLRDMVCQRAPILRILSIGGPAGLDSALMWTGHFIFLTFITRVSADPEIGIAAYAAHMIGIRFEAFSYLPAMAWGIAAGTLAGQALGAGDRVRARRVGHIAVLQLLPYGVLAACVYYLAAGPIYSAWSNDPLVHEQGLPALRLLACAQPALVALSVYVNALRGAGDTRVPLLFTLVGIFGVRVPLAYICGVVLKGGLVGAWIGMCCDLILRSLLFTWRFARGRWTEKVI